MGVDGERGRRRGTEERGKKGSGRRVSELLERFEERGDPINDGGIGGNHIMKPGGGPSCSNGRSKFKFSSPGLSSNSSEKILKLNNLSKSKFKLRVKTKDGNTESGVERDWLGRSANEKPG